MRVRGRCPISGLALSFGDDGSESFLLSRRELCECLIFHQLVAGRWELSRLSRDRAQYCEWS